MRTVSRRLFVAFLVLIGVVLVIVSAALLVLLRNSPLVERQTYSQLNNVATMLVREARLTPDLSLAEAQASADQAAAANGVRVLIAGTEGEVLVDSAGAAGATLNLRRFALARADQTFPDVRVGQARDAVR